MIHYKTYDIPVGKILNLNFCETITDLDNLFGVRMYPSIDLLTDHAYQFFKKLELKDYLMVFYQKPLAEKGSIHVDHISKYVTHPYSLNIVYKGQGVMKWFNPVGPGILKEAANGAKYKYWPQQLAGSILEEWSTGKIALVKTDIPHQAYNYNNETRICVSIRWNDITLPWKNMIDKLDPMVYE